MNCKIHRALLIAAIWIAEVLAAGTVSYTHLVCPEVLGGLPTPRCPAEIVQGVVTNKEGINVDRE